MPTDEQVKKIDIKEDAGANVFMSTVMLRWPQISFQSASCMVL